MTLNTSDFFHHFLLFRSTAIPYVSTIFGDNQVVDFRFSLLGFWNLEFDCFHSTNYSIFKIFNFPVRDDLEFCLILHEMFFELR